MVPVFQVVRALQVVTEKGKLIYCLPVTYFHINVFLLFCFFFLCSHAFINFVLSSFTFYCRLISPYSICLNVDVNYSLYLTLANFCIVWNKDQ